MCVRSGSKYSWPLYITFGFNLTTTNQLEISGLDEKLDIFEVSMGMLQILPQF